MSSKSSSHPAVRFERLPVMDGALVHFDEMRAEVLNSVVERTSRDLEQTFPNLELLLGESLYSERFRMKRGRGNVYVRQRLKNDQRLWNGVQAGLLQPTAMSNRTELLKRVLAHYSDEIGGHFDLGVYKFATHALPFGFSWLLNSASVKRFNPWRWTESLQSSLNVTGEITWLQNLSRKGTILLVPTHQSNIDSVLIGYIIYLMSLPPFAYGAGLNLFSNPLLSFFMSRLGAYTVDRQKNNAIYKQVLKNYSVEILKRDVHSIFFPGGGRSRSGAIESKLKLGLLGTALEAQLENLKENKANPKIYIVPMVMSYHFVLEASSLIEDYLAESGKHRFIITDDESYQSKKVLNFFWKLFSAQTSITARVGRPLDVFGNPVDENGESIGPNGTRIDPKKWLSSRGELVADPQRDREYTRELGVTLVKRYHEDNTVLTSHVVAYVLFETLRKQYKDLDLFRFLRISRQQRSIPYADFLREADRHRARLQSLADSGKLHLSPELQVSDTEAWVADGIRNLGLFHEASVVKVEDGIITTEDMNLLYYYRNRLGGYS